MLIRRNLLQVSLLVLCSVAGPNLALAGGNHGGGGGNSQRGNSGQGQGASNRPAMNVPVQNRTQIGQPKISQPQNNQIQTNQAQKSHTPNGNQTNGHRPPIIQAPQNKLPIGTHQAGSQPSGPNKPAPPQQQKQQPGTKVVTNGQPIHNHHPGSVPKSTGNTPKPNSNGIGQLGHNKAIDLHKTDSFLQHHKSGLQNSGLGQLTNLGGLHGNHGHHNGNHGLNGKSSIVPTNLHSVLHQHHSAHSLGSSFGYKPNNFVGNPQQHHHHNHNHGWNSGGYGYGNRWFGNWYYPVIVSSLGYGYYGYPYRFTYSGCDASYGGYGYCSTAYTPGCYGGVGVATIQPCSVTASSTNYVAMASVAPELLVPAPAEIADATNLAAPAIQVAQTTPDAPLPPLNDLPSFSTTAQDDSLELIPPSPAPPLVPQVVTLE